MITVEKLEYPGYLTICEGCGDETITEYEIDGYGFDCQLCDDCRRELLYKLIQIN